MWDSSGLGELDRKDKYVGECVHTEETSIDREMKVDGINEEREHC